MEDLTGLTLAQRDFVQYKEGFPFFPYFQSPYAPLFGAAFPFYFGYGPIASFPYPGIGGLQNQMSPFVIKAMKGPVTKIKSVEFIQTDGTARILTEFADFIPDIAGWRIAPLPGQRWPIGLLSVNGLRMTFTAGYAPQPTMIDLQAAIDGESAAPTPPQQFTRYQFNVGIPENLKMAILLLCSHYYFNRDAVASGTAVSVPLGVQTIIDAVRVQDFSPVESH